MSIFAIDEKHWLTGDQVRQRPIPGGSAMLIRRALVIHFTAGTTAQNSIEFWETNEAKGASAHIVIDRDGTIYQCRPFNQTCGHAGVSRWADPKTGRRFSGLNSCSIGIELANAGDSDPALAWAREQSGFASIRAVHRNGGRVTDWEVYPAAQLAACEAVSKLLVARYRLDDITGHDCIAPTRRTDPGPAFPLHALREACGFQGLPVVHR
jgi:N-acetylmuramoyl-L-alanine amidase